MKTPDEWLKAIRTPDDWLNERPWVRGVSYAFIVFVICLIFGGVNNWVSYLAPSFGLGALAWILAEQRRRAKLPKV